MSKVSFIVPVFNVEKYLNRCVDSLLNQENVDVEVILIDDCSTDGSAEIMGKISDSRIQSVFQPHNKGVSAARNRGLEMATGEWIAFCDGDDWYLPQFCDEMLKQARQTGADFVICNYQLAYDNRSSIPVDTTVAIRDDLSNKNVVAVGSISSCCHLFKRELFEKSQVKFPEGVGHFEELPVVPVLAKYATKIAVVNKPLYCYYQRSDGCSASNSNRDYEDEIIKSLRIMQEALGDEYSAEAEYHTIYALHYGEILHLAKSKASAKILKQRIIKYLELCPKFNSNPYYGQFGLFKKVFLRFVQLQFVLGIRLLTKIHSILVH